MAEVYSRKSKDSGSQRLSVKQLKTLLKHTGNPGLFSCYATFPPNMHFETQEDGEEVVLFLRQHLIVLLAPLIYTIIALAIPSVFEFFPPYQGLPTAYQMVVQLLWYLFVLGFAVARLMGWFFNIYILTDERIVDIDFVNILHRKISTAKLEEIQDVNVVASGALHTFFDYGNVIIQTAAAIPEFDFIDVPHPDKVGTILNQMIDMEEQEKLEGRIK